MPNALDLQSALQMQLIHHHNLNKSSISKSSTPNQLPNSTSVPTTLAELTNLVSMTSGTVSSVINNSLLQQSTNNLDHQASTMTTTSNINLVLNAQLNALGLNNLNGLNNLSNLTNLANLENTGDYQNTLLNQLNQQNANNLLNRTNGTSLDSLISSADSLSPVHSITTITNSLNNKKSAQLNKLTASNQQALNAASNGQSNPNLISELLNYYDLKKLYENMPYLNALYPALFGSASPILRDQHALAYKQQLSQVETPLDLSMSIKNDCEAMEVDPTDDEIEEQKLMNSVNYEALLNSGGQLLNLSEKQLNLLKQLANNQQDKKDDYVIKRDENEDLKKFNNDCYSPLNKSNDKLEFVDDKLQTSQKLIFQHLRNKQIKQEMITELENEQSPMNNSAPQSPASVKSTKSDHSIKSHQSSNQLKLATTKFNQPQQSSTPNGVVKQERLTPTNKSNNEQLNSTTLNKINSAPCSPISSPINNINLFNDNQQLMNGSRTSSPSNNDLDSQLLSKLTAFQQLLNQQQQQQQKDTAASPNQTSNNINSLVSNLMSLNRNGQNNQLNSMSTLNLLNNLMNNQNNNNLNSIINNQQRTNQTQSNQQSRNQLLNTLQKLNSLNNQNSQNSSFKDSCVNINNSNNSVSTVNSSSNGSKFNDSISNGPLNSSNNLQISWPNGQTPTSNSLVTLANNINSSLNLANGAATGQQLTLNGNVKLTLDAHCDTLAALQTAAAVVAAKKVVVMDDSNSFSDKNIIKKSRVRTMLPCEYCGKTFDRPSLLRRHLRTHTGEKPHKCDLCAKAFSTSSSLNTHRRIHTGDKPHCCPICNKKFTASSNLYYHKMTHSKEKPHKCSFKDCNKSFPTPGDLKSHSYAHNGCWPYQCPVCSRGFSKQTNLKNHLNQHKHTLS